MLLVVDQNLKKLHFCLDVKHQSVFLKLSYQLLACDHINSRTCSISSPHQILGLQGDPISPKRQIWSSLDVFDSSVFLSCNYKFIFNWRLQFESRLEYSSLKRQIFRPRGWYFMKQYKDVCRSSVSQPICSSL